MTNETMKDGAENFACYLIDNCENEVIREESVQGWLGKMLADPRYARAAAPTNETMKDGERAAFEECAASGDSCSYGPHGRHSEMQCRYCGKARDAARLDAHACRGERVFVVGIGRVVGENRQARAASPQSGETSTEFMARHLSGMNWDGKPSPQAALSGHAIYDAFLKWSEWTTELGEAISRKNIDGFVGELREFLTQAPTERMSEAARDAEDAAGLVGPAMVEHEFSVSPSSGIEICLHCGISKVAARTNTICDEASIDARKEYS
ncbi:MAG: hypothetical protein PW999_09790 [Paraburkholderia tropica]|nr:hypothetical protein [Paraburkholderia tropica]